MFAEKYKTLLPVYLAGLVDDFIYDGLGETMPHVLQDIVYRYMFADSKTVSA